MSARIKKGFFISLLMAGILFAIFAIRFYQIPEIHVVSVKRGALRETVEETGHIRTGESFDVQAPAEGRIIQLNVSHGQTVKAGQAMMVLQNIAVEAQLAEMDENIKAAIADRNHSKAILDGALADLEEARKEVKREEALLKAGAISRMEYEAAESNVRKAENSIAPLKAAIESAEHRLAALKSKQKGIEAQGNQMVIASPINSKVLSVAVKKGQLAPSGATLATVGSNGSMEVYAEILSDEMVRIHIGQPVDVTLGADSREQITGRIKEIYPQAVEKVSPLGVLQRRVPIIVALDRNGPLKPGYEVNLSICTAGRDNVLLAPRESISVDENGIETVKLIRAERITVQKIATGLKNQFYAEVLQGLNEGDRLVRDGSLQYPDGASIRLAKDR
jgi:HlyD family secretion protein